MDFDYFAISWIIAYSIAGLTIPIFVVRLLRTFPFYVKNGHMGDDENSIMFAKLSNLEKRKKALHRFLTETHPTAILYDVVAIFFIVLVLILAWIAIPPIAIVWFIFRCIIKLAKHMRKQHLKREEFLDVLKGDH